MLMRDQLDVRKRNVIEQNLEGIADLSPMARRQVEVFVDELQSREPGVQEEVLSSAVAVMVNIQKARSGQDLLRELARLGPSDWDRLYGILRKWTMQEAELVLDELHKRLQLIKLLEERVDSPTADELHDLQPLFGNGLWMFGPEYESVAYASNRRLVTVVRELFGVSDAQLTTPTRRPDFVVLPDASIGFYARDAYDESNEVCGIEKVLIVELKKGGYCITKKETRQADDYIDELRTSGAIQPTTSVEAYVLGSTLDHAVQLADAATSGRLSQTKVIGMTYSTLLARARARTFSLSKKIEELRNDDDGPVTSGSTIDQLVSQATVQPELGSLLTH